MIFFTQEKALCYPDIYNSVHHPTAIEWIHDIHALIFPERADAGMASALYALIPRLYTPSRPAHGTVAAGRAG